MPWLRLLVTALLLSLAGCAAPRPASAPAAPLDVDALLGGPADPEFARALTPRTFAFPADHGPHPAFRSEWWYFTGNLDGRDSRRYGYQLTFFRQALAPAPASRASHWATNQVYLAHFALSDIDGRRFHASERFARGALGLAGAQASHFRVWVEDWAAEGGADLTPLRLHAAEGGLALDLALERGKPIVLQGERGLSRKGPAPGDASYYYSLTRMPTRGQVTVGGRNVAVSGSSWMDREFSTSSLSRDQVGWDWFALQLDDGRELMAYRLRDRDGRLDPFSSGTVVERDGRTTPLAAADVGLAVTATWTSPRDGAVYPSGWRLTVPRAALDLTVTPAQPDQELDVSIRYWEGAVTVTGTSGGRPVRGRGYVELTGYRRKADHR